MPSVLAQPAFQPSAPSIEVADEAAARGDWTQAIAMWERLLDSPDRLAATRRIRWFLDTSEEGGAERRSARKRMLLASLACGLIGTVCVFMGKETSGTIRIVLAVVAWALYIATATLIVTYAYASGSTLSTGTPSLTRTELQHAHQLAMRQPATGGPSISGPQPLARAVRR